MSKKSNLSRKDFIKGVGGLAAAPWLSGFSCSERKRKNRKSHKILSCNIRVALPQDEEKGVGWSHRKELAIEVIQSRQPDIICLQEVLREQDQDMKEAFPDFFTFGFDGPEMDTQPPEGYHGIAKNTIMFSRERYDLISTGCYWLSETPQIGGSKSWGTARARHANWVRLKEHDTQKEFRVLNTHFDHVAQSAREKQAEMIVTESAQYPEEFPQILAGDFNQSASNPAIEIIKKGQWIDSYADIHGPEDPGFTGHGFRGHEKEKDGKGSKIDFIFSRGKVTALDAGIIKDHKDGFYPSDHYFISAEVTI